MTRVTLCVVLLSTACASTPDEPVVIAVPADAIERVCATLDEAARLAASGDQEGGQHAWRRAHAQYETELHPWVTQSAGEMQALSLDYTIGRVRAEMGRRRGHPREVVATFATNLRALSPSVPAT